MMQTIQTAHVIYKKSPYEIYIQKYQDPRMATLLKQGDVSMDWMLAAHQENKDALEHVRTVLRERKIKARWSYRARREPLENVDLVLAVGGDGTLLEAARMITDDTPLLGLRSTPSQSVGHLCAGDAIEVEALLDAVEAGEYQRQSVARIQAFLNDQPMLPLALNDILFAHVSPAATSRYTISYRPTNVVEDHRSSGVWVATPVGSTAAIRSAGGMVLPPSSPHLQFAIRELYAAPDAENTQLARGLLEPGQCLEIVSLMRRAFLFFDGPWVKRPVYFGDTIRFQSAETPLILIKRK